MDNVDPYAAQKAQEDVAMVGVDAMKRANSTLEDFVSSLLIHKHNQVEKDRGRKNFSYDLCKCISLLIFENVLVLVIVHIVLQSRSYFMFHHLEVSEPQSIFRYLPVLSFTESYIYQVITVYFCSVKLHLTRF